MRILILSGKNKSHSGGLGQDHLDALLKAGHIVDYNFPGCEEFLYKKEKRQSNFLSAVITKTLNILNNRFGLSILGIDGYYYGNGHVFFSANESKPPYDFSKVIHSLKGKYDLIIVLFVKNLINVKSMGYLQQELNIPVIFRCVDMYAMTGGCIYFGECEGYKNECYNCPAFHGKYDSLAHQGYIIKKQIYNERDIYVMCNTWVNEKLKLSGLFPQHKILRSSFTLNVDIYKPLDRDYARNTLGVPKTKYKILFLRHSKSPRKGCNIAYQAVDKLYSNMNPSEKREFLVITIGEKFNYNAEWDNLDLGIVSQEKLILCYNAASAFVCPSTDDAGPSMINQSMACGTPVVAFNAGTSVDVLFNGVSGYKAELRDYTGFTSCINKILKIGTAEEEKLRFTTRQTALKYNSFEAFSKRIESFIESYCVKKN